MRLIDPKMSIDTIKSYIEVWDCKGCLPYGETQHNVMSVDDLEYLPTIEAEPVRHGRWIDGTSRGSYSIYCSYCGSHKETICPSEYCPNCGARMDATDTNVGGKGGNG
jgi:hypothetical protein